MAGDQGKITLAGRVALVTGAGNGLGRAHARELARRGASVVVNDLGGEVDGTGGSPRPAQQVVDEIEAAGGRAVASFDSVATPEGGERIVATALDAFGRLDAVVNNAGILRNERFDEMTREQLMGVLDTHLLGAFHVSQPAYRVMRDQGYGRFVFTSSGSGLFGCRHQANYRAGQGRDRGALQRRRHRGRGVRDPLERGGPRRGHPHRGRDAPAGHLRRRPRARAGAIRRSRCPTAPSSCLRSWPTSPARRAA